MSKIKYRVKDAFGNYEYKSVEESGEVDFLIGYDWEGNAVYEGDELIAPFNARERKIAYVVPKLVGKGEPWSQQDFKSAIEFSHLIVAERRKRLETNLWRAQGLEGDEGLIIGALDFRQNTANLDRFDCYLLDPQGVHLVDLATLERVPDSERPTWAK